MCVCVFLCVICDYDKCGVGVKNGGSGSVDCSSRCRGGSGKSLSIASFTLAHSAIQAHIFRGERSAQAAFMAVVKIVRAVTLQKTKIF
jgi:hypothetical protein